MSRSDNERLSDIIRVGRRLAEIVRCGRDAFDQDWTLQDAAGHQIELLVDAYTKLSPSTRAKFTETRVEAMTGMRIHLAHKSWTVDYECPPFWGIALHELGNRPKSALEHPR